MDFEDQSLMRDPPHSHPNKYHQKEWLKIEIIPKFGGLMTLGSHIMAMPQPKIPLRSPTSAASNARAAWNSMDPLKNWGGP